MTSKVDKEKTKQLQDKCQSVLNALLRDEDNKYCVDCDSKGPRWASWNLGVFLCIRCAGIHRNLGVHISKVKSVNLDSWTPEQVVSLQQMGNSRARAVYEANLPDNFRRPQNDSSLETFIRAKYEHKKYIAREWMPPSLPEVNWEKEIDDEIDRQKRKKKSVVDRKSLCSVEVPQLPKPKNASPKLARISYPSPKTSSISTENKLNADLLGLQNGDDSFSGFLSGPTPTTTTTAASTALNQAELAKSEEESFFNQTAPTEKEKVKLTKDSILALYGSAPPTNNYNSAYTSNNQFNSTFPMQQQQQPQQQNFQNFAQFPQPQQAFGMQNGVQQQQPTTFPSSSNQFQNQFPPMANQFAPTQQTANFATNIPFPNNPANNIAQLNQFKQANVQTAPNPFFANQGGIHQQFGNMSLNGQNGAPPPTLASNIWQ